MKLTKEIIEQGVKAKGYKWFETGDYNINIVGVRNSDTGNEVTNKFDDKITLSFKCDYQWEFYCYDCTTDPGKYWVENIMRKEGVAVLKEGQYRGSHKIRLHQGRYEALDFAARTHRVNLEKLLEDCKEAVIEPDKEDKK